MSEGEIEGSRFFGLRVGVQPDIKLSDKLVRGLMQDLRYIQPSASVTVKVEAVGRY